MRFVEGRIEQLEALGPEAGSFGLIVSNCVVNLSPDKPAVLGQAHALLQPGGEMYFSDVYADRRISADLAAAPVLHGECLAGALYWNDFLHLAKGAGFADPRLVEDHAIAISDPAIAERVAPVRFYSATYRLFRLPGLEPDCEDYGQAVVYRGTVPRQPGDWVLDKHHRFATGKVVAVYANTYRMLHESRFAAHFDFLGEGSRHLGIFEGCATRLPFNADADAGATGASCC